MEDAINIILKWASQYHCCAVDNLPPDIAAALQKHGYVKRPWNSLRFIDGKYVAGLRATYSDQPEICSVHCIEAVIDYADLITQDQTAAELLTVSLEEVL